MVTTERTELDWERSVIATAVAHPAAIADAEDLLPSDFSGPNQIAWAELLALHARGGLEPRALINALRSAPDWEQRSAGMRVEDYLAEVLTFRGTAMPTYVEMVLNSSIKRAVRRLLAAISAQAEDSTTSAADLLDYAETRLLALRRNRTDEGYTIQDLIGIFVPRMQAQLNGEVVASWTPKVQGIKDVIDYMEAEDFMTVAARPGEGKSSYMRYEFLHAAKAGKSVGILNYENAPIEYLRYFLGIETGIDTHKLKNPHLLTEDDKQVIRTGLDTLSRLKIKIDTTPRTASHMIRAARRMAVKDKIELLGVDYIQLINNGSDNRANDIALTTGTLRQFALENHIPVIANAQLSRDIERRGQNENGMVEPELSDLRESGAIEQDSTIVMFPRPQRNPSAQVLALFPENLDGYGRVLDRPRAIPTTFYVKKNRNGNTGPSSPILWLKHTGQYRTLERGTLGR